MGRLLALGMTAPAASLVLAACSSQSTSPTPGGSSAAPATPAASGDATACATPPKDIAAEIRLLTGPFTENEIEVQEGIAAKFKEQYPNVTFTFKLFDWYTSRTEVQTSLAEGAHDIYYLGEGDIVFYSADESALLDISKYVNDPCFAADRAQITGIDRILGMSPYPVAVPYLWFPENALYVNMDKLRAAGFDETFTNSWQTFVDAAVKMTDPAKDEFGVALSLHNYVEWYGRLRSAGTDWVTPDLSAPRPSRRPRTWSTCSSLTRLRRRSGSTTTPPGSTPLRAASSGWLATMPLWPACLHGVRCRSSGNSVRGLLAPSPARRC
jgi:ABC-type glycerol-3-phosphate transport system substrate-binding protein